MATITTTSARNLIDMSDPLLVDFSRNLSAGTTNFSWFSDANTTNPPIADVDFNGTGFTYSGSGDGRELARSEEHTSELQSRQYLVCRLLLEKKKNKTLHTTIFFNQYISFNLMYSVI